MMKLRTAVLSKDIEVVETFLEHPDSCDWNWRDEEGKSVLELASMIGQLEIVRLLIQGGAPINNLSASGNH